MCRLHLDHIDHLADMIARLEAQIEEMVTPFSAERDLLLTFPGIGPKVAAVIIAEIGADIGMFPTAAHLPPGPAGAPETTNRRVNENPASPAKATPTCSRSWSKPPGRRSAPKAGSKHATTGWCAGSAATAAPKPRTRRSSRSPTPLQ
jgi:hypothetical protein